MGVDYIWGGSAGAYRVVITHHVKDTGAHAVR